MKSILFFFLLAGTACAWSQTSSLQRTGETVQILRIQVNQFKPEASSMLQSSKEEVQEDLKIFRRRPELEMPVIGGGGTGTGSGGGSGTGIGGTGGGAGKIPSISR